MLKDKVAVVTGASKGIGLVVTRALADDGAMVHTTCGESTTAELSCDHCGEKLRRRQLRMVAGPGLEEPNLLPTPTRFHSLA